MHARSEIDIVHTLPSIIRELNEEKKSIGDIIQKFKVKRTRLRSTTRTREFHFTGDMHATIRERFFMEPRKRIKK